MRLTVNQLLFRACVESESYTESFIDAWAHAPDEDVARDAKAYLEQLRAYRRKRWGRTRWEEIESKMKTVTLTPKGFVEETGDE